MSHTFETMRRRQALSIMDHYKNGLGVYLFGTHPWLKIRMILAVLILYGASQNGHASNPSVVSNLCSKLLTSRTSQTTSYSTMLTLTPRSAGVSNADHLKDLIQAWIEDRFPALKRQTNPLAFKKSAEVIAGGNTELVTKEIQYVATHFGLSTFWALAVERDDPKGERRLRVDIGIYQAESDKNLIFTMKTSYWDKENGHVEIKTAVPSLISDILKSKGHWKATFTNT